uniref:Uncharacterized protein n=1 Tax=Oryza brachyantha TaxID=4533 RepID=J3M5H0_ORYBR
MRRRPGRKGGVGPGVKAVAPDAEEAEVALAQRRRCPGRQQQRRRDGGTATEGPRVEGVGGCPDVEEAAVPAQRRRRLDGRRRRQREGAEWRRLGFGRRLGGGRWGRGGGCWSKWRLRRRWEGEEEGGRRKEWRRKEWGRLGFGRQAVGENCNFENRNNLLTSNVVFVKMPLKTLDT